MIDVLKGKKAIFFDVGYTLDYPASKDWLLTNKFNEFAAEKCRSYSDAQIRSAVNKCFKNLSNEHLVATTEEEYKQFTHFYDELSDILGLGLTEAQTKAIAYDRTFNMDNYKLYPGTIEVLETLGKTHLLGVISDTWPSIEMQLNSLGILKYFTTTTYSCALGTFKPDKRMYLDALNKAGLPAEDTVFIDDIAQNLTSAAELGITPILIAANPVSDIDVSFLKIHSLEVLLAIN